MTDFHHGTGQSMRRNRAQLVLAWLLLLLVLLVSFWLRGRQLWNTGWDHDEGIGLMFALLVNAGHPAYAETFVGFAPLALLTIQLGVKLFETTLAVRYATMILSLVGVVAVFWLFRPQKFWLGLLAGFLAAIFLSFNPNYFLVSSKLEFEVPAIAMATLSLVLAQQYDARRKIFWLILSGIAFGLSLTLKSLLVFMPALIGLVILVSVLNDGQITWTKVVRQLVVCGGAWLLGVAIPLLIFVIIFDPLPMYQQVLAFRLPIREMSIERQHITLLDNIFVVSQTILIEYGIFLVGAIAGITLGWRQYRSFIWPWCVWLVLALALMMWHIPFRSRYALMVIPPLAVLTGLAVGIIFLWLYQKLHSKKVGWLGVVVVSFLLLGTIAWTVSEPATHALSSPFSDPSGYVFSYLTEELKDAIDYARANTTTDDCIIADDPRFMIAAGRLPPPTLSLTSDARLMTNWMINSDSLVAEADRNDCPLVVYYFRRFRSHLPDLSDKLQDLYFLRITYTDEIVIYAAKKHVSQQPTIPFTVQLGDAISLQGVDLTPAPWYPGQTIQLATYWTALESPGKAYKIFLQLKNEQGETVAAFDHFPFPVPGYRYRFLPDIGGQYEILPNINEAEYTNDIISTYPSKGMVPTNVWPVDNTIREVTTMPLPEALPPGMYHLYIGIYDPDTLSRLPVHSGETVSDEFLIMSVSIE
jgi:hypothetical protein